MTTHTPDFDGTNPIVTVAPPSQTRATIGKNRLRTTMYHPEPRRYHDVPRLYAYEANGGPGACQMLARGAWLRGLNPTPPPYTIAPPLTFHSVPSRVATAQM
jgi:hypothetical protein